MNLSLKINIQCGNFTNPEILINILIMNFYYLCWVVLNPKPNRLAGLILTGKSCSETMFLNLLDKRSYNTTTPYHKCNSIHQYWKVLATFVYF